ncbi:MAG: hypothetical protein K2H66_05495 [Oscillospiraceae bacterium]|nr:hypothetical protein [Oscillospiraceae bacterium]
MYHYYYIKTDCRDNCWDTAEIQEYLRASKLFTEQPNGIFVSQNPFLDISLMKVKDLNSWSCLDFNPKETNYVSIVTSYDSDENSTVKNLFKGLEQLLCFRICPNNIEGNV